MNNRENLQNILNHKSTASIAVDFGSTSVTGIHVLCVENLRKHYGLPNKPVKVIEPYQMLGEIDDDLADIMGVTVKGSLGIGNILGFAPDNYKPYRTLWAQDVLVPEKFCTVPRADGAELIYPKGDTSAEPSGVMPTTGYFFDAINRQKPIVEENLNPEDNLEEFSLLTNEDLAKHRGIIDKLMTTDNGIVASLAGSSLGDIALVPGAGLIDPKGIRDVAEWYMSTVLRPDYVHAIFEKQTEIAIENYRKAFEVIGNDVDVVFICGTDFGTQRSQFCSGSTFDSLYAPYYRMINEWIHKNTKWKTFKHSCGAIKPLIPNMIEAGFDIINPVQFSADGMDAVKLKQEFGSDIVFWGGGVDTQHTLPFGKPEEVREQVLRQCEVLSKDGGFVFNAVHNIQANTPVENVAAMIDAVKEFNK